MKARDATSRIPCGIFINFTLGRVWKPALTAETFDTDEYTGSSLHPDHPSVFIVFS